LNIIVHSGNDVFNSADASTSSEEIAYFLNSAIRWIIGEYHVLFSKTWDAWAKINF